MSFDPKEEDLIDFSDEEFDNKAPADNAPAATAPSTTASTKATGTAQKTGAPQTKGSYVGVHSTGFRDLLLKPEILRAITDCGFEHPSEG